MTALKLGDSYVTVTTSVKLEVQPHGLFIADIYALASWEEVDYETLVELVVDIYAGGRGYDALYWRQFSASVLRLICASKLGHYKDLD